jgi:Family of unknown function (DUF5335)
VMKALQDEEARELKAKELAGSKPERKTIMKEKIDRSVWINYFNEFTSRNHSRPTRLEVFGELGAQIEERGLPLVGIAMGKNGSALPSVEIMFGGNDAIDKRHLTHVIANVQEITPKRGLDGRDEALEIVGEGYQNLLRFEPEARMTATA